MFKKFAAKIRFFFEKKFFFEKFVYFCSLNLKYCFTIKLKN